MLNRHLLLLMLAATLRSADEASSQNVASQEQNNAATPNLTKENSVFSIKDPISMAGELNRLKRQLVD